MPATALTKANKFNPGTGVSRCLHLPAVATPATGATRLEIDAGDDLSINLRGVSGWSRRATFADENTWGTPTADKVFQGDAYEDSTLMLVSDRAGANNPVAQLGWSQLDTFFIAFLDHGDNSGAPYDLFEVELGSISKTRTDAALYVTCAFGILNEYPDLSVPA